MDKIAQQLDDASEAIRSALHLPSKAGYPSDLYARCGSIVEILGRLQDATGRLHDATEKAPQTWALDSDDDTPAAEHVDAACSALIRAAAEVEDAYRLANQAFSALSHLKLAN